MVEVIQTATLLPTPFAECSVIWNDKTQTFQLNDYVDVIKCCKNKCNYLKSQCDSYCEKNVPLEEMDDCKFKCKEQQTYCADNCFVQDIKGINGDNPFNYCGKRMRCWNNEFNILERDCASKNKQDIINCCRRHCLPTKYVDCDKLCNYSFELAYGSDESDDVESKDKLNNNNNTIEQFCPYDCPCRQNFSNRMDCPYRQSCPYNRRYQSLYRFDNKIHMIFRLFTFIFLLWFIGYFILFFLSTNKNKKIIN